ncbi:MAG: cupin domain-containing protein [Betaproteobacteria bacterium]|nr:cupin domain-containing protein [Betaproteobacteria bacterium]MDH5350404.1 cupin domain-containing protein [Betaproteobacteria bacterium]
MKLALLGGLSARQFLRRYWQKRPLLVRGALPGFRGVASRAQLAALAGRPDVESRLVRRRGGRWHVVHGPLECTGLARNATLLVSGVNLHRAAADALLRRFHFLPQARLDDVMVSWAGTGGGVGPHVDSYDVFLVQGAGRRVWRLQRPRAWRMVEGAPLRLIADFAPDEEFLVEPGDVLYVPPGWGHDGVALEECQTCSVGLRAPLGEELAAAFLDFLHERGLPRARYRDPGLRPARHSAQIPAAMFAHAAGVLARIRWTRRDVGEFLGRYLTTPKPHVVFFPPRRPLPRAAFARRLRRAPVALDRRSLMLYRGAQVYLNGEALVARPALRALADRRSARLPSSLAETAYGWYLSGYLHLE